MWTEKDKGLDQGALSRLRGWAEAGNGGRQEDVPAEDEEHHEGRLEARTGLMADGRERLADMRFEAGHKRGVDLWDGVGLQESLNDRPGRRNWNLGISGKLKPCAV